MDWCKRYWDKGWKLVFVAHACAIHYGGGSSANAPVRFYIEMYMLIFSIGRSINSSLELWPGFRTGCCSTQCSARGHLGAGVNSAYQRRRDVFFINFEEATPV